MPATVDSPVKDGARLKALLASEGYSMLDLVTKGIVGRTTAFKYARLKKLKRRQVEHVLNKLDIPVEKFYTSTYAEDEQANALGEEHVPLYTVSRHQGNNIKTYLSSKGVSLTHFAGAMSVSRQTIYTWLEEKELPLSVLLEAAYVLNVPVALIKGHATGERALEKDIYTELKAINDKLTRLDSTLQKFAKTV